MKNTWLGKQRETRPERPEGLCGPLSFVTLRDDFAYVGIDRSRMDLSATTKVWIHNGVPQSAVVTFVLTERWVFLQKPSRRKDSNYFHRKVDKSEFTYENDTHVFSGHFHKDLYLFWKANDDRWTAKCLLCSLSLCLSANNKIMSLIGIFSCFCFQTTEWV